MFIIDNCEVDKCEFCVADGNILLCCKKLDCLVRNRSEKVCSVCKSNKLCTSKPQCNFKKKNRLSEELKMVLNEARNCVIPFGKFKGSTLKDVLEETRYHLPYLKWVLQNVKLFGKIKSAMEVLAPQIYNDYEYWKDDFNCSSWGYHGDYDDELFDVMQGCVPNT